MKLLSDATEYALRAVVWMAERPSQTHKARDIAEGTQAAPGYLMKTLQRLAKAGILSAQRGVQGGFTLACDPEELTVLEVINAVDPLERIRVCPLGKKAHANKLCPLHRRADAAIAAVEEGFGGVTIALLVEESSRSPAECSALCSGESIVKIRGV